ncbi:hypothetical protein GCM10023340_08600 [Nocardioides marinquilinus]|uniref:Uncharacterized protein n=1 Tax=Nocardioides marinquilinus TaxID=1210400 RepID=A0ABP9PA93_9ACTN
MATTRAKKYLVRDSAGVEHTVEAQAVAMSDDGGRVTFYSDAAKTSPVASFVNPPSWGPAS